MWITPFVCICASRNSGKALSLDTPIPTPHGTKKMKDVQVGDFVYDELGKATKVIAVSDVFYNHDCYEMIFEDGEKIIADANHLWKIKINEKEIKILETKVIVQDFNKNMYSVPTFNSNLKSCTLYKKIISVKKVPSVPTKCIVVDNDSHLFLCGEKNTVTHNSTISAPFLMAKSILFPNFNSYIISSNAGQAHETFMKIEKIAKKQISTFVGLNDFFLGELVTSNANKDGFVHKPEDFNFQLFNGSAVHTVTSNYDGERGKRSNCNLYDETGFMLAKAFATTEPFTTQDSNFKMGKDSSGKNIDISAEPLNVPNQLIYLSSASSVDTYFWGKYKDYAMRMFEGNKNYFCADINCELVLNPMYDGKPYAVSLLTQDKIDAAMRDDKETAMREYYNIFTKEGGEDQPFKRGKIMENSEPYLPEIRNLSKDERRIALFYDPARTYDNSVVLVVEYFKSKKTTEEGKIIDEGWKCKILNCVSLVDIGTKRKIPMQTPQQIEYIKEMILRYNGVGFSDYDNIEALFIDKGSGGAGVPISDFFMEDWCDTDGVIHRGLIDKVESAEYVRTHPNAINKIRLIEPKKYRTEMFDSLAKCLDENLIIFPEEYDGNDYLMIPINKTVEYEVEDSKTKKKEKKSQNEIEFKKVKLDFEEQLALRNINLMKTEIINIHRYDNDEHTNHSYKLPPDKINKMHDDRAYVLAMAGWYLKELRRENITKKKKKKGFDLSQMEALSRRPQIYIP